MYHLNATSKSAGLHGRLLDWTTLEMYCASSVTDFLNNRGSVITTSLIQAIGYSFIGNSGATFLYGKTIILLLGVDYLSYGSLGLVCFIVFSNNY